MPSPDQIKDAFSKVKQDMDELRTQIWALSQQIEEIKRTLQQQNPTETLEKPANQQTNPTNQQIPTDNLPLYAPKQQDTPISTGNGGVPTDRQTDSQTVQQTQKPIDFYSFHSEELPEFTPNTQKTDQISQIERVSEVLESLDSIKKEIRTNFKHLTSQEIAVFSAIYTLEEQGFVVDYSLVSQKLSLSESSIRDYTQKLIKKGIPLIKSKENNKKVTLIISPELKKIASLQTILSLRKL
jgi:chromosome segregation ATPase